ncbi:MAG: ribosome-associated translation inhibitor RaiA [Bacteroidota bacterium]|nr:ribosome-associated translation inhibitor RaiA [Bacteroidota bacterium]MDP3147286.1 ribosome-associated translation inhibitor RaiA [Bacteroidota bacterium]MDP3557340.1 ribosome-associated translation inhibitor RaiA [Bacteroidota bacterium]
MTINIQSVHFDADRKLLDFVNEKVEKLNKYYDGIINSEVTLKLDKNDNSENKVAEIRMVSAGHEFFAKKQCASFEEATDQTCEALRSQILKYKEKIKG